MPIKKIYINKNNNNIYEENRKNKYTNLTTGIIGELNADMVKKHLIYNKKLSLLVNSNKKIKLLIKVLKLKIT